MTVSEWETAYNQLKTLLAVIPSNSDDTNTNNLRNAVNTAYSNARTGLVAALNSES